MAEVEGLTWIRGFAQGHERVEFDVLFEVGNVAFAHFRCFQAPPLDAMLEKLDLLIELFDQESFVAFAQHGNARQSRTRRRTTVR